MAPVGGGRYTEYYPAKQGQAFAIAKEALLNWDRWLKMVEAWQAPMIQHPACPEWLRQGALNELYYATFGGSFWENGCITEPKKFGNRPGQHLASVMECQEYAFAETFDVRHHASRRNRDLWPQIERDILLVFSDFIMDSPDGSCPHDAGLVAGDPFFDYDGYGRSYITNLLWELRGGLRPLGRSSRPSLSNNVTPIGTRLETTSSSTMRGQR